MDTFDAYEVVESEVIKDKLVLDSAWGIQEERQQDTVATTSATGKIIDLIGARSGYVFFTSDATNAFWQAPIKEECYMYLPKEWLEAKKDELCVEGQEGVVWWTSGSNHQTGQVPC